MILTPRLSNSCLILAMYPSSVVHTGVKSLGCENITPQEFPSHSWKRIRPSVVCASKSGASAPIGNGPVLIQRSPDELVWKEKRPEGYDAPRPRKVTPVNGLALVAAAGRPRHRRAAGIAARRRPAGRSTR